ncbi:hypothetical protein XENOCAPTIV_002611 [Xenoophorus captivus]|uniref:Uncharacterized protein n=1 Tax=Xenoophorus captivus TaxID=1517983 RepID=A0ABV0RNN2_9TELE
MGLSPLCFATVLQTGILVGPLRFANIKGAFSDPAADLHAPSPWIPYTPPPQPVSSLPAPSSPAPRPPALSLPARGGVLMSESACVRFSGFSSVYLLCTSMLFTCFMFSLLRLIRFGVLD